MLWIISAEIYTISIYTDVSIAKPEASEFISMTQCLSVRGWGIFLFWLVNNKNASSLSIPN